MSQVYTNIIIVLIIVHRIGFKVNIRSVCEFGLFNFVESMTCMNYIITNFYYQKINSIVITHTNQVLLSVLS